MSITAKQQLSHDIEEGVGEYLTVVQNRAGAVSGKQDAQTVPSGIGPKTAENGPKTSRTVNTSPESIPRRISNGRPVVAHNSIMPFTQGRAAGKTAGCEAGIPHLWHLATNVAFLCELEEFNAE